MENSEKLDNITSNIKCQICYEKFIKLTQKEFYNFLEDNKELLPDTFEDNNCCRCYEDRFECFTCKNIICKDCYWSFQNHKFRPDDEFIEEFIYFDRLDENGLAEGTPGEDCPIICPFCRTKDYKIFYGNQVPYELLNEIKNYNIGKVWKT
jgi:hypothetical protein